MIKASPYHISPCQVCGMERIVIKSRGGLFWVECEVCGATTKIHHSIERAIEAWNAEHPSKCTK